MQQLIDITGQKFGRLEVLGLDKIVKKNGKTRTYWRCLCDCGSIVSVRKDQLIYSYSRTKSCGCWHREESSKRPKDLKSGKYIKLGGK